MNINIFFIIQLWKLTEASRLSKVIVSGDSHSQLSDFDRENAVDT